MKKTLTNIRALILDMDGVLWRGDQLLIDPPAVFERIARVGAKALLMTNNATRTVEHYFEKFARLGVRLAPWQVLTSAQAAAQYLRKKHPNGGTLFVIGEDGLLRTLKESGFDHGQRDPLAVVAGLDRQLTYDKLRLATLLIRSGVPLVGTNPDRSFPTPEGLVPGAGAILAALEAASDVSPLIIGKPQPIMYRQALQRLGTRPEETLAVGDRLETDIQGAQACGCKTALVLSGVTTPQAAHAWRPPPDLIAPDLNAVLDLLQ